MAITNINLINQILDSLSINRKESRENPFKYVLEINSDLEKIKNGQIHSSKVKIRKFARYSVYPDMKVVVPTKFDSNIVLKDSKGKTLKIPFFI